jgi:hypothetical protein
MPRRGHTPDPVNRRQVESLAGYGVPETEIAELFGIDPKTLRKHYRFELDHGHTKANARVAENLFRNATGEGREAITAAIFWRKTRARWREKSRRARTSSASVATLQSHSTSFTRPSPARLQRPTGFWPSVARQLYR